MLNVAKWSRFLRYVWTFLNIIQVTIPSVELSNINEVKDGKSREREAIVKQHRHWPVQQQRHRHRHWPVQKIIFLKKPHNGILKTLKPLTIFARSFIVDVKQSFEFFVNERIGVENAWFRKSLKTDISNGMKGGIPITIPPPFPRSR